MKFNVRDTKRAIRGVEVAGYDVASVEIRSDGSVRVSVGKKALYVGAREIGRALGCSPDTVCRMVSDGRLKAVKSGSRTSPLKVERAEIDRLLGTSLHH